MMTRLNRRRWLAAATGAVSAPALAKAPVTVRDAMPLLALNEGRWRGRYTFITPAGEVLDSHHFQIRVLLSDDPGRAYRQETEYRWEDGRAQSLVFEAAYADRQLSWDNGRIAGRLWEVDEQTIYLRFSFAQDPSLECFEMIQVSSDGQHRGRSWLWYRNGQLARYTLVDEHRDNV